MERKRSGTGKRRLFFLCLFLFVFLSAQKIYGREAEAVEQGASAPQLTLNAKSALLLDATNNRVLFEKNGYEVLPMASTTKIMTCILALEQGNLEDEVTVSKRAAKMPKVHLGMREGESYKMGDLLYSLMLESHNDTAVAIAEHIGGSVEGFAEMMNQKAKELGCNDTFFITPNGLDASIDGRAHATTAYDLARIAAYAIKNEKFLEVIGTPSYSFHTVDGKRGFQVNNKDQFLHMVDGAVGIKTGFTGAAGYCFVGAVKRESHVLVSVVLGCGWPPHKSYKWKDTKAMMSYGLENYVQTGVKPEEIPEKVRVAEGVKTECPIVMEGRDELLLLSNWDRVESKTNLPQTLNAPVEKGVKIGEQKLFINGEEYASFPICTAETVGKFDYRYCVTKVVKKLLLK